MKSASANLRRIHCDVGFEGSAGRIECLGDPAGNRDAVLIRSELSSSIGPYRFTIQPTRMSS
jgi:hypothetical protein